MKKVILILSLCLLFSCKELPKEKIIIRKFQRGEIVSINNEAFQVDFYEGDGIWFVTKIDCRSNDCCYQILESEISKFKK